jgi:hypothetical protein
MIVISSKEKYSALYCGRMPTFQRMLSPSSGHHNLEDPNLYLHWDENFKSHITAICSLPNITRSSGSWQ